MTDRLLIPGPTNVHPDVAAAAMRPMIGHRGPQISELLRATLPRVAALLNTENSVYPLGCSATGAMEAAVRNAAPGPILHLVCGAFSKRWSQIRAACGLDGDEVEVEWGEPILPQAVASALQARNYTAVTLVHNETSTGVLNPLADIGAVMKDHPETLLLVDTVSSMAAVELRLDDWGVDVCLAGTQKAWAMPPGLTLCAVSQRALARSQGAPAKGFYLDWQQHEKSLAKWQTPSTPPISLIQQLQAALDRVDTEGLEARYARHAAMRDRTLAWAAGRFVPFARAGYRSASLSALRAGDVDVAKLLSRLAARGIIMGAGYGKTKADVFRVGHMGEWTLADLDAALALIDEELRSMTVD